METETTLFARKLAYCREFLGFSKKDMASIMDVSPSTYARIEKGLSIPSVESMYFVSLISEVCMEDYVNDEFSMEDFIHEITVPFDQRYVEAFNEVVEGIKEIKKRAEMDSATTVDE